MSVIKLDENSKSKSKLSIIKIVLIALLGFALLGVGLGTVGSYSKTVDVNVTVMSTDTGTYYNAQNGGSVSVNGTNVGANKTQVLRLGQQTTLKASPNQGYSFVGYFTDITETPLSTNAEYSFIATEDASQIYASFAKNYDIEFNFVHPYEEGRSFTFTKSFYVGQEVTLSDVIANNEDEELKEFVEEFVCSTPESDSTSVDGGFSFSENTIVVGTQNAQITVQPSSPVLVGLAGTGTKSNPFIINDDVALKNFAKSVTDGTSHKGRYFKVTENISVSSFEAIGTYNTITSSVTPFEGYFDGNDKIITISSFAAASNDYSGLFGYNAGVIQDITVASTIKGGTYVGGIAGYNTGTIINSKSTAAITATGSYVGGIVGVNSGIIKEVYNSGSVTASNGTFALAVGGVVGMNLSEGKVYNAINSGAIAGSKAQWLGGLIGQNHGILENSFSTTGAISGNYYVGGVVGQNSGGIVVNTYSNNTITASATYAGGVAGFNNQGTIKYSYYRSASAKAGSTTQNGLGGESVVADVAGVAQPFTTSTASSVTRPDLSSVSKKGKFSTKVDVNGYLTDSLLDAMNYGQAYISNLDRNADNVYYTWGSRANIFDTYPTFYYSAFGTEENYLYEWTSYGGGDGNSEETAYEISAKEHLYALANNVAAGETYEGKFFKVMQPITLTSEFRSIGWYNSVSNEKNYFGGTFDGGNELISGFNNTATANNSTLYFGLFGYVGKTGVIKNVTLSGDITGATNYVGGIVGFNEGLVSNVKFTGTIASTGSYVGGIVGVNSGTVCDAVNQATINANGSFGLGIGGVVGMNLSSGLVYNLVNTAKITAPNYQWVGGLVGQSHGMVANGFNQGAVSGSYHVGGVLGQNGGGELVGVYNRGTVSATGNVGGVLGYNNEGRVKYTYYLNTVATNGIGGTANKSGVSMSFTSTSNSNSETRPNTANLGRLSTAENIAGHSTTILLDVLNFAQSYLLESGHAYQTWGVSGSQYDGYPSIYFEGSGFDTGTGDNWTGFTSGDGKTAETAYVITTELQLRTLAFNVNSGNATYEGQYFKLGDDITLTEVFTPIGWYDEAYQDKNYFAGTFDGNNKTIIGLTINASSAKTTTNVGLFGYIGPTGVVKNFKVTTASISGATNYVGGIAGYNTGTISNVSFEGTINASGSYIGGIVGVNSGTVYSARNAASITGSNGTFALALGGIIGINLSQGSVYNAVNEGIVSGQKMQWVGGIVGQNHGVLNNSFSSGAITGQYYVGGIVGQNGGGSVMGTYSMSGLTCSGNYKGGIAGLNNEGVIQYSYYLSTTADAGIYGVSDTAGQTIRFTSDQNSTSETRDDCIPNMGRLSSSENIGGFTTTILLDALNFVSRSLAAGEPTYQNWGAFTNYNNGYPTLYANGFSTDTNYTSFASGDGKSEETAYVIMNEMQLRALAFNVNNGTSRYEGVYFKLGDNIDLSKGGNFTSIGSYNDDLARSNYFGGFFDGAGFTISGMTITTASNNSSDYMGLFGHLSETAVVKNITVTGASITGGTYIGGIAGYNMGLIENVSFAGTISASGSYIGGIVGVNSGTITKAINKATVTASSSSFALAVGGIVGMNLSEGVLYNDVNLGAVSGSKAQWVGGIVGQNHGLLENAFSEAKIAGQYYVGGIVGQNSGGTVIATYSRATAAHTATSFIGGVAGFNNQGSIRFSYYLSTNASYGIGDTTANAPGETQSYKTTSMTTSITRPGTTSNGELSVSESVGGYATKNLLDALNLAQKYLSSEEKDKYLIWGASSSYNGGYPTIYMNGWSSGSVWAGFDPNGGDGNSPETAYLITQEEHLVALAYNVNGGESYEGKYFKVGNSFSLNSNFRAIGWYDSTTNEKNSFDGIFDGNHCTISGLTMNATSNNSTLYMGLFGHVGKTGVVKNLTVTSGNLSGGTNYVAGIVAFNEGTVENVRFDGSITSSGSYVGGIVAVNSGTVNLAYNTATITANSSFGLGIGGVVGMNLSSGLVANVVNTATVTAPNYQWVGGLVGQSHGRVANGFNQGAVSGSYHVGGVLGQNGGGELIGVYNRGTVSATGNVGGVLGYNNAGIVKYTYYLSTVATYGIGGTANVSGVSMSYTSASNSTSATRPGTTSFGQLSTAENIAGYSTKVLLDALNFAQNYLSESGVKYCSWSAVNNQYDGYPTIYVNGFNTTQEDAWIGYASGDGLTEETAYVITTQLQLRALAFSVNSGSADFEGMFFRLGNDIALDSAFTPIGWYDATTDSKNYFAGNFDGDGKKITGLQITAASSKTTVNMGLFGYVAPQGVIKNLIVQNATITGGTNYVGGIAGYNTGTISNVTFSGSITASGSYIGGIAGVNSGLIDFATNQATVTGENGSFALALGGIVGINLSQGTIQNCHNDGITSSGVAVVGQYYQWVGGIAGQNHGTILNSYNNMPVTGNYYVGGIVGQNGGGEISNVYNRAKITSKNNYSGGIVGFNNGGQITYGYYSNIAATRAVDGNSAVQNGIGHETKGSRTADATGITNAFNDTQVLYTVNASNSATAATVQNTTNLEVALQKWCEGDPRGAAWVNGPDNFPKLSKITYTLTANANGGTISTTPSWTIDENNSSIATKKLSFESKYGLMPNAQKLGYDLIGWQDEEGEYVDYDTVLTIAGDITITAVWEPKPFVVTLNANEGTIPQTSGWNGSGDTASKIIVFGTQYGTLPTPTRGGNWLFDGWYTDATNGTLVTASTILSTPQDHTLYAHWRMPQCDVTANANDGTISTANGWSVASGNATATKTVTLEEAYGLLPVATRAGYTFAGWFTAASGGTQVTSSTIVNTTTDHSIYAHWTANTITITLNNQSADTNSGGTATVYYKYNTDTYYSNSNCSTKITSINIPVKTGYTFGGYYSSTNGGGTQYINASGAFVNNLYSKFTSNTTLYAKWTPQTYTITLTDNYGSGASPATVTATFDSATLSASITAPTRTGYTFLGWYSNTTAATGVKVIGTDGKLVTTASGFTSSGKWIKASNVTLYSVWENNSYTITLNQNGATTNGTTSIEVVYQSTTTVASQITKNPEKTGYKFEGWYTSGGIEVIETDGVLKKNVSGYTNSNGQWDKAGIATLYAHWTPNTYTLTLNQTDVTTNGTQTIYVKYDTGFYSDIDATTSITKVTPPQRTGWAFQGYYTSQNGAGDKVISADGTITAANNKWSNHATLYAHFTINTYTLTITYYDARITNPTNLTIAQSASTVSPTSIASGGTATVKHTYDDNNLSITIGRANTNYVYYISVDSACTTSTLTNSITYSWAPNQDKEIDVYVAQRYTITYANNTDAYAGSTGTLPTTPQYKVHGTPATIGSNNSTLTGYTKNGWTTTSGSIKATPDYANGASYTANKDLALYLNWKANTYTVSFEENGGSAVNDITVTFASTYGTLPSPTRTGYTFAGWYKESGLTNQVTSSTTVTTASNHTLYAKWTSNVYEITLSQTNATTDGTTKIWEKYNTGFYSNSGATTSITTVTPPQRTGWTFQGYYTSQNGAGDKVINADGTIAAANTKWAQNATIYAHFTINSYTFTVNYSGLTGTATNLVVSKGGANAGSVANGGKVTITNDYSNTPITISFAVAQSGYKYAITFGGSSTSVLETSYAFNTASTTWTPTAGGSINVFVTQYEMLDIDAYLNGASSENLGNYATAAVTIGGNSAASGVTEFSKAVPYNSTYSVTITAKTNVALCKTDSNTQGEYTSSVTYSGTLKSGTSTTTTLKPYCSSKYTIEFNGNTNNSGTMSNITAIYGVPVTLTANAFAKTGHDFMGWTLTKDASSVDYANSATVESLSSAIGGLVTLYAKWTLHTYTLTINYVSMLASADTNLSVSATGGNTITGGTIAKPTANGTTYTSATVKHTYTTTAQTITISAVNANAAYYIDVAACTTSTQTINSKDLTWAPTSDQTINVYVAQRYAITYHDNTAYPQTGNNLPATGYKIYGKPYTLEDNDCVRAGYLPNGWTTSSNTISPTTTYVDGYSYTTNADLALYINWKANKANITIQKDGSLWASSGMTIELRDAQNKVAASTTATASTFAFEAVPAGQYSIFASANSGAIPTIVDTDLDITIDSGTGVGSKTINFYTITVTSSGNGIESTKVDGSAGSKIYLANQTANIVATMNPGYTFNAWSSTGNTPGAAAQTTISASKKAVVTATAKTINYTLTYDANGGTVEGSATKEETFTVETDLVAKAEPTRPGYSFDHWKVTTNSAGNWTKDKTYDADANIGTGKYANATLTAQWTANTYTVTFNTNGGTAVANKTVTFDAKYGTLSNSSKTGYTFSGWYLENTFVNNVTQDTYVKTPSNHVLYAKWTSKDLVFANQTLPHGIYDTQYNENFNEPTEGTGSYTYQILSATFDGSPISLVNNEYKGLKLEGHAIKGTPNEAGTFVFTVKATDTQSSETATANITVEVDEKTIIGTATITGDVIYGNTLTAIVENGYDNAQNSYTYVWGFKAASADEFKTIAGQTSSTIQISHAVVDEDVLYNGVFKVWIAGSGNFQGELISENSSAVAQKELSWTTNPTVANKAYDGQKTATITNPGAISGVLNDDDCSLNSTNAVATFADAIVGTNKTVTITGYALSGTHAQNYKISSPANIKANITKAIVKVSAATGYETITKEYDKTTNLLSSQKIVLGTHYTVSPALANNIVTYNAESAQYDSADAGERTVYVTFTLTDTTNFAFDQNGDTIALEGYITQATPTLAITSTTISLEYGKSAQTNFTYDGDSANFAITSNSSVARAEIVGKNITVYAEGVGSAVLTLTAAETTNYYAKTATINVTVSKAKVTVSPATGYAVITKPYDGTKNVTTDIVVNTHYTVNLSYAISNLQHTQVYDSSEAGQRTVIVTFSLIDTENFEFTSGGNVINLNGEITQATLTIAANPQTTTYGTALHALTIDDVTITGFIAPDTISSLSGSIGFDITTTPSASTPAGSYTITPKGLTSNDYKIVYQPAPWTVNKKALSITANSFSISYGEAVPTFTVATNGFVNNDDQNLASVITYTLKNSSGQVVEPSNSLPAGNYTIIPSGYTSPNYTITYNNGTLAIGTIVLTTPTSLAWHATNLGTATWSASQPVAGITITYQVRLYLNGAVKQTVETTSLAYNFDQIVSAQKGAYTFDVTALSSSTASCSNSSASAQSANLYVVQVSISKHTGILDATISGTESLLMIAGKSQVEIFATAKSGYTFSGWTSSSSFLTIAAANAASTAVSLNKNVESAADITLTANATANEYTVSFEENGGTEVQNITVTFAGTYSNLPQTTRGGYTFDGWFTETSGGTKVTNDTPVQTAQNHTLYAHWSPILYNITLNANGGEGGSINPNQYSTSATSTVVSINWPVRTGYTLVDWDISEVSGNVVLANSKNSLTIEAQTYGDFTVTAVWEANPYTIKFAPNGNTNTAVSMADINATYDEVLSLTTNAFVRQFTVSYDFGYNSLTDQDLVAYTFEGWSSSVLGGLYGATTPNTSVVEGTKIPDKSVVQALATSGTVTLTANWSCEGITLPNLTDRTGYDFLGWKYGNQTLAGGSTFVPTEDATLVAQWQVQTYTITAKPAGGTMTPTDGWTLVDAETATKTVTFGQQYGALPNASRTGYDLVGWFTLDNTQIESTTVVSTSATNQFIYAHWSPVTYTIDYVLDGGISGENAPTSARFDKEVIISTPSRTGYIFEGWKATNIDPQTAVYVVYESQDVKNENPWNGSQYGKGLDEVIFKNLASTQVQITLQAFWSPDPNTKFVVTHYVMNDKGQYEQNSSNEYVGPTGSTLTASDYIKSSLLVPNGIVYAKAQVGSEDITTTTIKPDGTLVITLYYERLPYTVTVQAGEGVKKVSGTDSYYYGQSVEINALEFKDVYVWSHWIIDGQKIISDAEYTFDMPANNVVAVAYGKMQVPDRLFMDVNNDTSEAILVKYYGSLEELIIPNKISVNQDDFAITGDQYEIVEIYANAFNGNTSLVNVRIPETVRIIGDYAFANCNKLEVIEIASSNIQIGSGAFGIGTDGTGLDKTVYINDSYIAQTVVESAVFFNPSLGKLDHGNLLVGVTTVYISTSIQYLSDFLKAEFAQDGETTYRDLDYNIYRRTTGIARVARVREDDDFGDEDPVTIEEHLV